MKLLSKNRIENCLPTAPEYRYVFSEPWRAGQILRLRRLGELDYYPDFPRPFFRLRLPGGAQMKGVEGDSCCRIVFSGGDETQSMNEFDRILCEYFGSDPANQGGHEWE